MKRKAGHLSREGMLDRKESNNCGNRARKERGTDPDWGEIDIVWSKGTGQRGFWEKGLGLIG